MYNYIVSFQKRWTQALGSRAPRIRQSNALSDEGRDTVPSTFRRD
jgi:hypothetical protein